MTRARIGLTAVSLMLVACTAQPVSQALLPSRGGQRSAPAGVTLAAPSDAASRGTPAGSPAATSATPVTPSGEPGATPAPPLLVAPLAPDASKHALSGLVAAPVELLVKGGLASRVGGDLVSNGGGSLVPLTKLVSDNGGSLVPMTQYVAGRGGAYRLLSTPDQALLAGATVRVLDAAGRPVAGPDGKPLSAVTDAQGAYRFDQALPAEPVVLRVELGAQLGALVAISTPGASGRRADLDLVSTLTSAYTLERYVRPQENPVETLRKLPAAIEAEARARAAEAVAGGKAPLPCALATDQVLATVETLRQADAGVEAKLKEIERLLVVVAGQSDLGAGQLATRVSLGIVLGLTVTPANELLIGTARLATGSFQRQRARVWRLSMGACSTDRLEVAVQDASPYVNTPGAGGVLLPSFSGFGADAEGRTLLLAGTRVGRLEADGSVTDQGGRPGATGPVRGGPDGTLWTVSRATAGANQETITLVGGPAGAPARQASPPVARGSAVARSPTGGVALHDNVAGRRHSYDPATDAWTSVTQAVVPGAQLVDAGGNVFVVNEGARTVSQRRPDGSVSLLATLPAEAQLSWLGRFANSASLEFGDLAVCAGPDGAAYVVDLNSRVYRLAGGQARLVAGLGGQVGPNDEAGQISLAQPNGLGALPDGTFLVVDAGRKQVLRVTRDRKVSVWGGDGEVGLAVEGQPVAQAHLAGIVRLLVASNGDVHMMQHQVGKNPQLLRVGPDGVVHVTAEIPDALPLNYAFTLVADVPYVRTLALGVRRLGAGGTLEPLAFGPSGLVGGDARGSLWLVQVPPFSAPTVPATLLTCQPPSTPQTVVADVRIRALFDSVSNFRRAVVDGQGRLVFCDPGSRCVWRLDPRDKGFTAVAGEGSLNLVGATADEALTSPVDVDFAPNGDLLVLDDGSKQVKIVPAARL